MRLKTRQGALIVDKTGRGETVLSALNKGSLERRRVVWVEHGADRRPVSLFQTRRSPHLRGFAGC